MNEPATEEDLLLKEEQRREEDKEEDEQILTTWKEKTMTDVWDKVITPNTGFPELNKDVGMANLSDGELYKVQFVFDIYKNLDAVSDRIDVEKTKDFLLFVANTNLVTSTSLKAKKLETFVTQILSKKNLV